MATEIPAALGLSPHDVRAVLETAGRAPSVHNTQPWAFRVAADVIELHADLTRRLPVADPEDRELRLGCGAALFTLRLALQGHDVRPDVARFPDHDRPELVAQVRRGGAAALNPEMARLLAAVGRRGTNRHPFTDVPVEPPEQHALCRAAAQEAAQLHIVRDRDQRRELSRLAHIAHRRQLADPEFRAELARWTGTQGDRSDGVPAYAGGLAPEPHDTWVLRDFTGGTARDRPPGKDFEDEPMIAVLTSHIPGATGDVQAGEALQRVLLTAAADGLAVSFLSQLVEVPDIRDQVGRLLDTRRPPHAVLRIGRGSSTPRTPRRDVADLLHNPSR